MMMMPSVAVTLTLNVRQTIVENMKCVASSDEELVAEEHKLLSVVYKNVIGTSWRIVLLIEQKELRGNVPLPCHSVRAGKMMLGHIGFMGGLSCHKGTCQAVR